MITFVILVIALLIAAFIAAYFGVWLIAAFGDLVIFGLIVYALVKLFRRKKK